MTSAFEQVQKVLKKLPGLGYRSAERVELSLLVEHPETTPELIAALQEAAAVIRRCSVCGNLAEGDECAICTDPRRERETICVVEHVPDLIAFERAGAYRGLYHVLYGKLSPINGIGPEQLNLASLGERLQSGQVRELILALANDVEGEATCHYITESLVQPPTKVTRIGFGLPS